MTFPQIDFDALRPIGWPWPGMPEAPAWLAAMAAHPLARPARVSEQHRTGYVVADAVDTGFKVESLPEWQRPRFPSHERAAVGDWVLLEDDKRIVALLPRRTAIKRGAAGEHYHQQVIAANIDTVFIVCGLDADFNPRRIERYLLLVGGGGAEPVVILTKADLTEYADDALAVLEELAAQSIPLLTVNAKDADSVAALRPWLGAGRTAVLVGSSGAGKSTLTNTLLGVEKMRTAAVRENDSRGRHTTTHRALLPLPSGACLIDTPGMRELKPTGEEDLAEGGFADIEALAAQCRFNNCAHQAEPGCAVQAAIERGDIEEARLANYMKLRDEVAGAASKLAQRQAQNADAARSGRPGAGKPGGKRPTPRNQRR
ncbi:ribosome small subunit-dependent GTPase A [Xanthomonas translucens]|uniref:Small ribosomal subunit biogenesis GTPase RsgA n=5 Tax=Xanthomonas campestris pv. translucens TaxID=343 RepID=A0A1C3TKR0_XANCT|nr:ribosome small subunit-dependent GTPase A [Xanthomonas translucens]KTF40549.1 GTPase RsgA [Xanthomonas translucens pv. translucens]MCS3361187.1 ribosome small subunit-dependent GTPase A [Xanthomonas translucens pv. translucens]MCS3374940.1 ribosome small subunit-dependent GTPase A [Xanthomonas translucens pv. translucens]MCT8274355.1 ribosome small subunit-dependent GTPase A [Xanthomonas translucens pv. translucens]MCT8278265.1 ribosome small subunit-dependent GTPase A [Xanthomonas transluc